MGIYLSSPKTEKSIDKGESKSLKWVAMSMQGKIYKILKQKFNNFFQKPDFQNPQNLQFFTLNAPKSIKFLIK